MNKPLDQSFVNARNLLNSSPDMIIAVDSERKIIEFNAAAEKSFGYDRSEVIGKPVDLLYAEPSEGSHIHKKTIKNGHTSQEITNIKKNGEVFNSYLSTSILNDSNGNKIGVMGVSRDITNIRNTEAQLRASKEYSKIIIDCSMDMIIAVDNKRKIIEFNKAAVDTFGYQPEEVMGKSVNMLYADPDEGRNLHLRTSVSGKALSEVRSRRKNGEEFISLISASLMHDESGEQVGVMGISRDITSDKLSRDILKRSEERHRLLSVELAEANILKELLLDVITHDMKNTLGTLNGMAELLLQEYGNNEYINVIGHCTSNLMDIIENASILTQVTLGEEIEKKEINLNKLLMSISQEYLTILDSRKMTLKIDIDPGIVIKANPIISEVFKNYISNAIIYASEGKRIIVRADVTNSGVTVEVIDFGQTIEKENYHSIFNRKVQLAGTGKNGRGLGLAIVKRISDAHSAKIGVKPNTPNGNKFFIKFPTN
ncbi:MAG: PAS domain S-box protein [Fidelibacterota bacterium]